jgi:hypothetical protein
MLMHDNASELQYARCAMFSEQITKCKDISLEKIGCIKIRSTYMGDVDGSRTLRAESHKLVCNTRRLIRVLDLGLRGDRGVGGKSKELENHKKNSKWVK